MVNIHVLNKWRHCPIHSQTCIKSVFILAIDLRHELPKHIKVCIKKSKCPLCACPKNLLILISMLWMIQSVHNIHYESLCSVRQVIKDQRLKAPESPKPLRFLEKIEKPVPRPPTPSVEAPSEVGGYTGTGMDLLQNREKIQNLYTSSSDEKYMKVIWI